MTTEVLREGRHAYARALVRDAEDTPVLAVTGTFTDLASASGLTLGVADLPPMPDPARTIPWPPESGGDTHAPNVFSLFRHRVDPAGFGWAVGEEPGDAVVEAWATPAFGDWDPLDLLVLADVYPPPIFNAGVPFARVPTLELTVQLRGLPAGDAPLACRFWTSSVTDGYLEEDGLIRAEDGRLLAVSRQLALAPRHGTDMALTAAGFVEVADRVWVGRYSRAPSTSPSSTARPVASWSTRAARQRRDASWHVTSSGSGRATSWPWSTPTPTSTTPSATSRSRTSPSGATVASPSCWVTTRPWPHGSSSSRPGTRTPTGCAPHRGSPRNGRSRTRRPSSSATVGWSRATSAVATPTTTPWSTCPTTTSCWPAISSSRPDPGLR